MFLYEVYQTHKSFSFRNTDLWTWSATTNRAAESARRRQSLKGSIFIIFEIFITFSIIRFFSPPGWKSAHFSYRLWIRSHKLINQSLAKLFFSQILHICKPRRLELRYSIIIRNRDRQRSPNPHPKIFQIQSKILGIPIPKISNGYKII